MKLFVFVTCRIFSILFFSFDICLSSGLLSLAIPGLETGIPSPTLTPHAHGFFRQSPPRFLDCYCRPNTGAGPNNIPNTCSAVISPLVAALLHCCTLHRTTACGQRSKLRHYYCLSPQHDTYAVPDTSTQPCYPCQRPMAAKPLVCNIQFNLFAIYHSSPAKSQMYNIVMQTKEHRNFKIK